MARSLRLRDLSLSLKFRLVLGIQLTMVLLLCAMGWWTMGQFEAATATAESRAPKLQALADLRYRMTHYRGDSLAALVAASKSPQVEAERKAKLDGINQEVEVAIEKVRGLTFTPEQRTRLDHAIQLHQAYVTLVQSSWALANGDRDGSRLHDLFALGKDEVDGARAELTAVFENIQQRTHEETVAVNAIMLRIQIIMGVIVAIGISTGIGINTTVIRQVTRSAQAIREAMARFAQGDLSKPPQDLGSDELGSIASDLGMAMGRLRDDIQAISQISEQNASAATELAATVEQLNSATHEVGHGVESQRTAMEQSTVGLAEVSRSMIEIQAQAREAGTGSESALAIGAQGMAEVEESQKAMAAIEESSSKVGRITSVIADIARQTNLLSLNAAIEAAKAGTQGKGFAVVAEEIRKLAERSGAAAKEINVLIQESTERVAVGASSVGAVSRVLSALEASIRDNGQRVQTIVQATTEQARSTEEVVGGVETTAQLTERNASATTQLASSLDETNRTVDELAQTANRLRDLTARFKLG
jgi:methyl-accepting chemotaxis protein